MATRPFWNVYGSCCTKAPKPLAGGGLQLLFGDYDQRRWVDVHAPNGATGKEITRATCKFIGNLPLDVVKVNIALDGTVLSTSKDPNDDRSRVPFYPPRTDFPGNVATVCRSNLTEVDRLTLTSDLVTYPKMGGKKTVEFHYYWDEDEVTNWWYVANCVMRIPRHPNIIQFNALVVDNVGGVDRVVGFTIPHVRGELFSLNMGQTFKLKHLEQLIDAVDHLNLRLGIVHGDVSVYNLSIDPETDHIQLRNFSEASKLGWEGDDDYGTFRYDKRRNDVKYVVLAVYDIITRKLRIYEDVKEPRRLDHNVFLRKEKWVKHRHAKLDSAAEEYHRALSAWVKRRAKTDRLVDHFSKASSPLSWPPLRVDADMIDNSLGFDIPGKPRREMIEQGKEFVKWERPGAKAMPPPKGMRLLATGKIVPDDA